MKFIGHLSDKDIKLLNKHRLLNEAYVNRNGKTYIIDIRDYDMWEDRGARD